MYIKNEVNILDRTQITKHFDISNFMFVNEQCRGFKKKIHAVTILLGPD